MTLSITALCHPCDECRDLFIVMLNVIMLSVVMLNVVMPSVVVPELYHAGQYFPKLLSVIKQSDSSLRVGYM
jgi:hypothetical protein